MPLLHRLFWPLLTFPTAVAALIFLVIGTQDTGWLHLVAALCAPACFGLLYWGLRRTYLRWSEPPPASEWNGALYPPEPVIFVSRGGFLTPGSATVTQQGIQLFAAGRLLLSLPLQHVAEVSFRRGRWLRTPYMDLHAADGRRLARVGLESAETWVQTVSPLLRVHARTVPPKGETEHRPD
ncbi:MAG: hypothetical protein ACT4TC_06400 [Myxococcaceae bacterium]